MTRRANVQVDEPANLAEEKRLALRKAFEMWMHGWLLVQRGAREVRAEPSGQGFVGIARPVGARLCSARKVRRIAASRSLRVACPLQDNTV